MRMKWVKNENENNEKRTGWEWNEEKMRMRIIKKGQELEWNK